jgi:aldehyde:ferredoxin oxidoreductase
MERLFNSKAGLTMKDDTLPPRFLNTPLTDGFSKDKTVPVEIMLRDYYYIRGWDEQGMPKPELLKELGL